MKKRLLAGLTAVVLTLSMLSSTALANHFVYLGDDSRFQRSGWSGDENWIFYWWALSSTSMWWWAESDLDAAATSATSMWNTATGMPFLKVSTQSSADVVVLEDNSLDAFGTMNMTAIVTDSTRNVNWMYKGEINIRNAGTAPVGGWGVTTAHEFGHAMGLHERYRDDGGSGSFCNAESTIMNSGSCDNRPTTPSSLDISRINGIYKTGDMLSMSSSAPWYLPGRLWVTWKDGSWGEYEHRVYLYRWNGSSWVYLADVSHTPETGMRQNSFSDRTISRIFARSDYGQAAGYYIACGWPRYMRGTVGNWACSNYSWVN